MSEDSIEYGTVLDICKHHHRRIVLATLAEEQRPLTLNDLTHAILRYNHQTTIVDASNQLLTQIQQELYRSHIPKLESIGVVEYDPERRQVEPTEQFDQLHPYLPAIIDADPNLDAPIEF